MSDLMPLSMGQRRMWFSERVAPADPGYRIQHAWLVRGELERDALRAAVDLLVRRHDSLRTVFRLGPSGPWAKALVSWPDHLHDGWSVRPAQGEAQLASAVAEWIHERRGQPMDLATGPLLAVDLLALPSDEVLVLLTFHHIAVDGVSLDILMEELGEAYSAYSHGRQPQLLVAVSHAAAAAAQARRWRRPLRAEDAAAVAGWREELLGAPAVSRPPPDVRRDEPAGAWADPIHVVADDVQWWQAYGRRHGCTQLMTFLAIHAAVLVAAAGTDEVVIGVPSAGRAEPGLKGVVGCLVSLLPVRISVPPGTSLDMLLGQVRQSCLTGMDKADVPFEEIVAATGVARVPGVPSLVQTTFSLGRRPRIPRLAGMQVQGYPIVPRCVRLNVEMHLHPEEGGIEGYLLTDRRLYSRAAARRLAGAFLTAVAAREGLLDLTSNHAVGTVGREGADHG